MTYRIELGTAAADNLVEFEGSDIARPNFKIAHSQLADWSFETHYEPDLTTYAEIFAPIRVYWNDSVLFHGEVVRHKRTNDGPGGSSLSRLEGHDRAFTRLMRSAPLEIVEYEGTSARDAIEDYWFVHTPYDAEVAEQPLGNLPPIDHVELTDDHLTNLQRLHDRANFIFTSDHSSRGLEVTSMARGQRERSPSWDINGRDESTALSVEYDDDRREYANIVVALGAHSDEEGGRLRYDAVNTNEVRRLRDAGCPPGKSCATAMISDPDAETPGEVRTMAETELARRVEQRQTKGSLDVLPTWVQPGFSYRVDELSSNIGSTGDGSGFGRDFGEDFGSGEQDDDDGGFGENFGEDFGGSGSGSSGPADPVILESIALNIGAGETATLNFVDAFGYAQDVATVRGQITQITNSL